MLVFGGVVSKLVVYLQMPKIHHLLMKKNDECSAKFWGVFFLDVLKPVLGGSSQLVNG